MLDSGYNGLYLYNGTWYCLQNGWINWNNTTLVQYVDGNWYYVDHGQINWDYVGPVEYYDTWYYVAGGKVDWNYNGTGVYDGNSLHGKEWNCIFFRSGTDDCQKMYSCFL